MRVADSLDKFAPAFVAFQAEVVNPSNSATNPHFNSTFAPLDAILNYLRPLLAKHGLAVFQSPCTVGDRTGVVTMIVHASGQFVEGDTCYFKDRQDTAQGSMSCITYARRGSLLSAMGVAGTDDDDGAAASGTTGKMSHDTPPPTRQKAVNKPQGKDAPPGDYPCRAKDANDRKEGTMIVVDLEVKGGDYDGMILALFLNKNATGGALNHACSKAGGLLGRKVTPDDLAGLNADDFVGSKGWVTVGNNKQFPIDAVSQKRPVRDDDFEKIEF